MRRRKYLNPLGGPLHVDRLDIETSSDVEVRQDSECKTRVSMPVVLEALVRYAEDNTRSIGDARADWADVIVQLREYF
jgi:hypothetical protein